MKLQEADAGASYRVQSLSLPVNLERRLESLGLIEGSEIFVLRKKRRGAMIVKVRGTRFAMGYGISTHITVEEGAVSHGVA